MQILWNNCHIRLIEALKRSNTIWFIEPFWKCALRIYKANGRFKSETHLKYWYWCHYQKGVRVASFDDFVVNFNLSPFNLYAIWWCRIAAICGSFAWNECSLIAFDRQLGRPRRTLSFQESAIWFVINSILLLSLFRSSIRGVWLVFVAFLCALFIIRWPND